MPPVVLLTGAGAGGDITLPLDAEPTSVMLAEVWSREDGEAVIVVDAPPMRQHARKCAQQRLRARSPTQGSGGPTGRWRGNVRATAAATHTQLNSHPSCIDRAPSPSYPITLKLSKSIEHLWYDASPVNQGAAAP